MWTGERGHVVRHFDGVMSHSFKSNPLSRYDCETTVTKGWNPLQPNVPAERVGRSQSVLYLCRQMASGCAKATVQ
jgi:hypothetical protein